METAAVPMRKPNSWVRVLAGVVFTLFSLNAFRGGTPWEKLGLMTLGLLFFVKALAWRPRTHAAYWAWPGLDAGSFQKREKLQESAAGFEAGWIRFLIGASCCLGLAIGFPYLTSDAVGWLGIGALILTVHLGIGIMMPILFRLSGWRVGELFSRPWSAASLTDFWSSRWNLAFVGMNRFLVMPVVRTVFDRRSALFAAFLVSGLFHELAISYPAGAGWGLPFSYFAIQAAGLWVEHRFRIRSRLFLWGVFFIPLPLLFHGAFRAACVVPVFESAHGWLRQWSLTQWSSFAIWVLGGLQLLVLAASLQVPSRMNWKSELKRLSSLNEKLVWTYGTFIVFTILAIGVLTLVLHDELLVGNKAARAFAGFAFSFWLLRLAIDKTWLKKAVWPKGPELQIGHALLATLFQALTIGYGVLAFGPVGSS